MTDLNNITILDIRRRIHNREPLQYSTEDLVEDTKAEELEILGINPDRIEEMKYRMYNCG